MQTKIRLDGLSELKRGLESKPKDVKPALQRILQKHGAALQQKEMRAVPVDTGTLKRSIILDVNYESLTATVEPTAHYASYVEYGTRYMNAQPFVRPSYNAQVTLFRQDVKNLSK